MSSSALTILYIHDYPHEEGGGIEVQTYQDAERLVERGHTVTIATTRVTSETFAREGSVTYPHEPIPGLTLDRIDSMKKLEELIEAHDIVHIHATFSLRAGMMSAMKLLHAMRRPYFCTLQTTVGHLPFSRLATEDLLVRDDLLRSFAEYLMSDRCQVIGVSKVCSDSLASLGVEKEIQVVYNAKNWDSFLKTRELPQVDVTYVGEISWMKGLHVLFGALNLLKKDLPAVKVRIVGNGQNLGEAKALAASLELHDISFVNYVKNNDIPNFMTATKVMVVPSLTESWCNVAMEALGLGVPIVASGVEGLVELTQNGKLGLLFEKGNSYDCYRKLLAVLAHAVPQDALKTAAYIRSQYEMTRRIDTLLKIYRKERLLRVKKKFFAPLVQIASFFL